MGDTSTEITQGWDTLFAIRYTDVNAALQAAYADPKQVKSLPAGFQQVTKGLLGQFSVTGTFQPWKLTPAGADCRFLCGIASGTFQIISGAASSSFNLDGDAVEIQVGLKFINDPAGTKKQLKVADFAAITNYIPSATGALSKLSDEDLKQLLPQLTGLISSWCNAHIPTIGHVFAEVDVNAAASAKGLQWLRPVDVDYAVNGGETCEDSILGVFCMTETNTRPAGTPNVTADAIPSGARAGFTISREQYLRHFVWPTLPSLFDTGIKPGDDLDKKLKAFEDNFTLSNDNKSLTNKNALTLVPQQLDDNTIIGDIQPKTFTLELDGSMLIVNFDEIHIPVSAGIDAYVQVSSPVTVSLDSARVKMSEGARKFHVNVTQSEALKWINMATGIVLSIAGGMLGGAIGGAIAGRVTAEAVTVTEEAATAAVTATAEEVASVGAAGEAEAALTAEQTAAREAGEELYQAWVKLVGPPFNFANWFSRAWPRMLGGAIGAASGATIAAIPQIMTAMAQGKLEGEKAAWQTFTTEVAATVVWPNGTGFKPTSAQLCDAFQFGGDVDFKFGGKP